MTPQKLKIHVRFNKRKKKKYKVSGRNWKSKKTPTHSEWQSKRMQRVRSLLNPQGHSPRALQTCSELNAPSAPCGELTTIRHEACKNLKPLKTHFKLESRQYTWWSMFKWQKKRDSFPINTNLLQINEWHGWKMCNWTASVTSERLCFHF